MTLNRIVEAKTEAHDLLKDCGIVARPVPVERIAKKLGIEVIFVELEDGISGFLKRRGKSGKPVVAINKTHPENRQRFTIAHEIAHYILHSLYPLHVDTGIISFRNQKSHLAVDAKEIQANQFAAELLMPQDLIVNDLGDEIPVVGSERGEQLVKKLARKYKVSEQAMAIRLDNMMRNS